MVSMFVQFIFPFCYCLLIAHFNAKGIHYNFSHMINERRPTTMWLKRIANSPKTHFKYANIRTHSHALKRLRFSENFQWGRRKKRQRRSGSGELDENKSFSIISWACWGTMYIVHICIPIFGSLCRPAFSYQTAGKIETHSAQHTKHQQQTLNFPVLSHYLVCLGCNIAVNSHLFSSLFRHGSADILCGAVYKCVCVRMRYWVWWQGRH